MKPRNLRPGYRKHFSRCVELHGAGAQWNHRGCQTQILGFEPADIAQQLGLGMMGVKNRMGEKWACARQRPREIRIEVFSQRLRPKRGLVATVKNAQQISNIGELCDFIERNSNAIVKRSEINFLSA